MQKHALPARFVLRREQHVHAFCIDVICVTCESAVVVKVPLKAQLAETLEPDLFSCG